MINNKKTGCKQNLVSWLCSYCLRQEILTGSQQEITLSKIIKQTKGKKMLMMLYTGKRTCSLTKIYQTKMEE